MPGSLTLKKSDRGMERPASFTHVDAVTNADTIARISCSEALNRRERPVALFTAALLFTHGGFDRDPVVEFDARFPASSSELRPFYMQLTDGGAFFRGMRVCPPPGRQNSVDWNRRLYCIDETRKDECFAFLRGILFSCPKTHLFGSTFSYELAVPDPTAKSFALLTVTVFGVLTNKHAAFLAGNPPAAPTVRVIDAADARLQIPSAVRSAELFTGFNGEDPLTMRDD